MDAREASHLRAFPNATAAAWHHRRSELAVQSNLDRLNHSRGQNPDYRTRPGTGAGPRGMLYQQSNRLRSTPARTKENNELDVCLSFEDHERFNGIALLDTGAMDNWISGSLSRKLLLPRQNFREEVFTGFEGKRVKCSQSVHGLWHYEYQTLPVTFKICNDLPVDILFGFDLLRRVGLVDFDKINEENRKKVLVLAKLKADQEEQQQNAAHQGEQKLKAEKAERWQAMNNNKNWTWDNNERRFWTTNADTGTKTWSIEKW